MREFREEFQINKLTETTQNQKLDLWINRIKECRSSELTVRKWCEQQNIGVKPYYYWMGKIKRELFDASLPSIVESPIKDQVPAEQTIFSKIQTISEEVSVEKPFEKPAATLRVNNLSLDIHNGADQFTIEFTLQAIKRFC